ESSPVVGIDIPATSRQAAMFAMLIVQVVTTRGRFDCTPSAALNANGKYRPLPKAANTAHQIPLLSPLPELVEAIVTNAPPANAMTTNSHWVPRSHAIPRTRIGHAIAAISGQVKATIVASATPVVYRAR